MTLCKKVLKPSAWHETKLLAERIIICGNVDVKGDELLKKLKSIAKERGIAIDVDQKHGKGSHGTVHFGGKKAILPYSRRELPTGTLNGILKQLGLKKEDLQ